MLNPNIYTYENLLNVSEELQRYFHFNSSPFVSAKAIVGVHKAVLHAFTVFDVDSGTRDYIATMQRHGHGDDVPVEELIRRRIAEIEAEQSPQGYPADWTLRGLAVILRDMPLAPYRPDRSLIRKAIDHLRDVPTQHQMREHEKALLAPIGRNLIEIIDAYTRGPRHEAA